jgi:hypothetical protein
MKRLIHWLFFPPDPRSTILIRSMAGGVFLWEGMLKFVYANQGIGRFTKLGIPFPGPTAHFVAVLEIVGGLLLMAGFLTRVIAIPFVIEMIVAILDKDFSISERRLYLFRSCRLRSALAVLHEISSDYAQIMSAAC